MKKAQTTLLILAIFSLLITSVTGSPFSYPTSASERVIEDDPVVYTIIATENNDLIGTDINNPGEILRRIPITGFEEEGEKVNSLMLDPAFIDNPPEGSLPLFAATNRGRFYFIDSETGVATRFGRLQLFVGEDFDVMLDLRPTLAANSLASPSGAIDNVTVATPTEFIDLNTAMGTVTKSSCTMYSSLDQNNRKEAFITEVFTVFSSEEGRVVSFGFDKNQCAFVKIDERESIFEEKLVRRLTTVRVLNTIGGAPVDKEKMIAAELHKIEPNPDLAPPVLYNPFSQLLNSKSDGSGAHDLIKSEDEIMYELLMLDVETGNAVSIGFMSIDSTIRAVVFTRDFELQREPDFAISAEQPAITLKRGEKLKNFKININRLFGFEGNIIVSRPDVLPAKVKVKPVSVSTSGDSISFNKIKAKLGAEPDTYQLEFTATDASGRVRKAIVNLVIE